MKRKFVVTTVILLITVLAVVGIAGCSAPANDDGTDNNMEDSQKPGSDQAAVEWGMDSDCGVCHTAEQESTENTKCLVSLHFDSSCASCHDDEASLSEVHSDIKAGAAEVKRLKSTSVSSDSCLSCHGSLETLVQATASSAVLTDKNGVTVNPHEVTTVHNLTGKHDEIACLSCHKMHSEDPIEKTAYDSCLGCHHTETYECGTCHGDH